MQIAIGLTHLCDPYFNALDSIIAGYAVSISEASLDCECPKRIQETVFELQDLSEWRIQLNVDLCKAM